MMRPVFIFHLVTLISGLLCLTFGFLTTFLYWVEQKALKSKKENVFGLGRFISSLETADKLAMRTLHVGVGLLTLGIFSGVYLAHFSWPAQNWLTDKKVLMGSFTWLWYLLVLLFRKLKGYRGRQFLLMLLVGYLLLIVSFILSTVWAP